MLKVLKISITSILFVLFTSIAYSQKVYTVRFLIEDETGKSIVEKAGRTDSIYIEKKASLKLQQLYSQGYLSAKVISNKIDKSDWIVTINKGRQFQLNYLSQGNIDPSILEQSGIHFRPKKFELDDLPGLFNKILDFMENNGYPFAIIKLDSIQFGEHGMSASLNLFRGPKIKFEGATIKGYDGLKKSWLENYLGIKEGEMYSEKKVKNIEQKLRELSFVNLIEPPKISFTNTSANVELSLKSKQANSIDGVIGFLPNQRDNTKMLLIGSFNLHLYNLFSSAKQLHVDWQKVNVNSQTLATSIYYPQLFKMPLGITFDFNLLKEDTLYLNRYAYLKVDFNLKPRHKIFFSSLFENSARLGQSSSGQDNFQDYQINYYGIVYQINYLDDNAIPSAGSFIKLDGYAGSKSFIPIDKTDATKRIEQKSTQYKIETHVEHYFQIAKGYQLRWRIKSGNIIGENVFKNDLFRIGGFRTIRGFNENFFFTSDYAFSNLEFRIMQNAETYLFAFYDQGFVYDKTSGEEIDYPRGTGMGLNLGTKSGLFSVVVGLGKSRSQNFSLNSAKFHFGYLGRF